MGIEDRDYYRSEGPDWNWRPASSAGGFSAVGWMILISAGAYVAQLLIGDALIRWFGLWPAAVFHGQLWRLATYDFLHDRGSPWHILWNMYLLYITGREFEQRRGSREFIAFYLTAGVLAGVTFVLWSLMFGHQSPAIGASGAVMAVMIVYALTYPRQIWMIFGIIPVPVWVIAGLTVILDLHPMLLELAGEGPRDRVAHSAHVGGMLFGALYWKQHWRLTGWSRAPSRSGGIRSWFRRQPKLKIHREPDPPIRGNFERQVDQLLEKVAEQGEASLTAEERSILIEASRRARDRRSH